MINKMPNLIRQVIEDLDKPEEWRGLRINRRKPHTERLFKFYGDIRACLHHFSPCEEKEAFPHPHAWDMAALCLEGGFFMFLHMEDNFWESKKGKCEPRLSTLSEMYMGAGCSYTMTNPMVWHTVVPVSETYTIMFNSPTRHHMANSAHCVTTDGKELEEFDPTYQLEYLEKFKGLLSPFSGV